MARCATLLTGRGGLTTFICSDWRIGSFALPLALIWTQNTTPCLTLDPVSLLLQPNAPSRPTEGRIYLLVPTCEDETLLFNSKGCHNV